MTSTKMSLLLLLSLLPLVVTRGFAISSPLRQSKCDLLNQNQRIPQLPLPDTVSRGGARKNKNNKNVSRLKSSSSSTPSSSSSTSNRKRTIVFSVIVTAVLAFLGYEYRTPLASIFNKEALQNNVLTLLHKFHGDPKGIILYVAGMSVWELFGMSTIPVETAAGMVFGFRRGFLASASGKLLGACMGFLLGKTVFKNTIQTKLETNPTIQLISHHVNQNPYKVALLLRYSLLPEFVKNCGASLFSPPISLFIFILSVIIHGWMYSACWTYVGMDAAKRLEIPKVGVDRVAQFAVLWATFVGMVVTPILMAWWIRDMQTSELNIIKEENKESNDKKKNRNKKKS